MNSTIRIGTRGSKLALWQAEHVAHVLQQGGLSTEIVIIETTGDKILNQSFISIGSKGLFTQELEDKLQNAEIDIAVHSAKDLQSDLGEGLDILAFTEREKAHDVVLSFDKNFRLKDAGTKIIGSSSSRRRAVLRHLYPGIQITEVRGNLQTRLQKMKEGQCEAMLLAYAGVHRMLYEEFIVEHLSLDVFTPAVGQGTLAIESSSSVDSEKRKKIRTLLNHPETEFCLLAERAFLKKLQGGCSIPSFAYATLQGDEVSIHGGLISLDGKKQLRKTIKGNKSNSAALGIELAESVLNDGGEEILKEIKSNLAAGRSPQQGAA